MKLLASFVLIVGLSHCTSWLMPAADLPHPLGLNFSKHGVKAQEVKYHPRFSAAPLPSSDTSMEAWFYSTDQKSRGACGPFSASEAFDAVFQKGNANKHCIISRLGLYQDVLVAMHLFPQDAGVNNDVMLLALQKGSLLESTWPYSNPLNKLAPVNAANTTERNNHVMAKGYTVPFNDGGYAFKNTIHNIRVPVIIGRLWFNSQFDESVVSVKTKDGSGKSITVKRHLISRAAGGIAGGHDITGFAYDDNAVNPDGSRGMIEFHNHWKNGSSPWGDSRGSAWMGYKDAFNTRHNDDWIAIELVKVK